MIRFARFQVSPANGMPEETVRNGGNLVVCNLQKTHLDENSKPRIFAKTDALMEKVGTRLGCFGPITSSAKVRR